MHLQIQTSNINTGLLPISNFAYLVDLARCSKCQMFIALKRMNKLYGASDDCCSIHEIEVPFLLNTDLVFRMDEIEDVLSVIDSSVAWFIPESFPWVILSEVYWDHYIHGNLEYRYDDMKAQNLIYITGSKEPIEQIQMYKVLSQNDFNIKPFFTQLSGLLNIMPRLSPPHYFNNLQNIDIIRNVYDNKVTAGASVCRLKNEHIDISFFFYKSLVSLAKADILDLEVRMDPFMYTTYLATFLPTKKKNPLKHNPYGIPFKEKIHCMYANVH